MCYHRDESAGGANRKCRNQMEMKGDGGRKKKRMLALFLFYFPLESGENFENE